VRRLNRRGFLRLSAAAATGVIVAACAPATPQIVEVVKEVPVEKVIEKVVEKVVTATPKPAERLELDMWYRWGTEGAGAKSLVACTEKFSEDNPLMQVKAISVPAGGDAMISEKLMTAILSGNPPEIAEIDMFLCPTWAARAAWEDLTPLCEAEGIDVEEVYFLWAADEMRYQGRVYAQPLFTDLTAFAWNKDIFREVGLDPERPPQSAEELVEYADKIDKKEAGKYTRIGFDPTSTVIPWALGYFYLGCKTDPAGDFYDFQQMKCTCNHPRIVEALEWKTWWCERYGMEELDSFTAVFGWGEMDPLGLGLAGMEALGSWMPDMYREYFPDMELGISFFPIPEKYGGLAPGSCMGTEGLSIPRGVESPYREAAWEYIKWQSGPEGALMFNKGAHNQTARKDLNEHPFYRRDPLAAAYADIAPCGFNRPAIAEGGLLWTELLAAGDKAIHGQGEPQDLLDEVARKVDEAMEKW
jgi:multiple sugar transport system substrate-binding protein